MDRNLENTFTNKTWENVRGSESRSGDGSTKAYTQKLRQALPRVFSFLNVKTFLDAPCGDWNWMQMVDLSNMHYIGMDIVEEIVDKNQKNFGNSAVEFKHSDITTDPIPDADLMMVRDCLFHLTHELSWSFFENFCDSNVPFLLVSCHENKINTPVEHVADFRPLNLRVAPFHFPPPAIAINDTPDFGSFPKRIMGVWSKTEIQNSMTRRKNA